ncbi:uncharacterized protein BDV17DRAFT_276519 [Aspergillus undulatus]|uniref:uncharacterized protein n=1 Tax=Aspergillus undulatus TaxID=1810928 RepID=UPI003CCDC841
MMSVTNHKSLRAIAPFYPDDTLRPSGPLPKRSKRFMRVWRVRRGSRSAAAANHATSAMKSALSVSSTGGLIGAGNMLIIP